ncbi:NUDIX hydrolase [Neoasaia chiangmaiensis]|uniref:NrtR DNA-binding winged helix domain-containing protein n=1 Tax=Neoasaia chiangmaiensis TaxID=320497 RepID=A0A1U9KUY8_9PROT|nr:hypothetical protein [Neoasaia chiangmaiensis]AQS89559.1 hypothetical protein A0U93_14070 [Neoasaia chiangmaiensis]
MRSELVAVLIAVQDNAPMVLTLEGGRALPSGPLEMAHRSLQTGMRLWVEQQTGHRLGHVEQLYTFADAPDDQETRLIRISYMALTRMDADSSGWRGWYAFFPWEDQSSEEGEQRRMDIGACLRPWNDAAPTPLREGRLLRMAQAFGLDGHAWDDELVLQRYELLWEAGLVPESPRYVASEGGAGIGGMAMMRDHRRILATAMARLRAKIRYRPVIFELMPERFTLLQLQQTVEAVAGRVLHKQNFRRLIQQQALVEETPDMAMDLPGRPARLFRFRREVIGARQAAGSKLPIIRPV